jgi:hypothetical protein
VNVPQRGAIATLFAIAVLALINWASTWVTPSGKGIIVQGLTLLLAAFSWSAEGWTAFATLLTALATMILALCTYVQARLTREMIKVARDEYVASHRPKLILRQAFSLITDPLEATIVVQYTITNIGETRCWMTSCHLGVELVSELKYPLFVMTPDMSYPNNVPFIGAIGPGESKALTFIDKTLRWDQQNRRSWTSPAGIHFVGHITYLDEPGSNVIRQMAFRRKYDIETQRFHRIWDTDNEHEYAD